MVLLNWAADGYDAVAVVVAVADGVIQYVTLVVHVDEVAVFDGS